MSTAWTVVIYRTTAQSFMEDRQNCHPYSKTTKAPDIPVPLIDCNVR